MKYYLLLKNLIHTLLRNESEIMKFRNKLYDIILIGYRYRYIDIYRYRYM